MTFKLHQRRNHVKLVMGQCAVLVDAHMQNELVALSWKKLRPEAAMSGCSKAVACTMARSSL